MRVEEESSPHASVVRQPSLFHVRIAVVAIVAAILARTPAIPGARYTIPIAYVDARAAIVGRAEALPSAFQGKTGSEIESSWPAWVTQHNAEIRARHERGDEDSLVNFWLYGTSFTRLPRATERDLAKLGDKDKAADLLSARLDDTAIARPGTNLDGTHLNGFGAPRWSKPPLTSARGSISISRPRAAGRGPVSPMSFSSYWT